MKQKGKNEAQKKCSVWKGKIFERKKVKQKQIWIFLLLYYFCVSERMNGKSLMISKYDDISSSFYVSSCLTFTFEFYAGNRKMSKGVILILRGIVRILLIFQDNWGVVNKRYLSKKWFL